MSNSGSHPGEAGGSPKGHQDARRLELEEKLDEIRAFDARLEQVIIEGFASSVLDGVIAKEPLDKWTSRDGRAPAPAARDALFAQERKYNPDLNDGVRVNVAPLQRAGLLPADLLAAKDVEKAIADRAEWRATSVAGAARQSCHGRDGGHKGETAHDSKTANPGISFPEGRGLGAGKA